MVDFFLSQGVFIFGLVFLIDDLGIPFPSGSTLFAASILAAHEPNLSPVTLFLVTISYSFLGNFVLYQWGRHGAQAWLRTHGHKFFLPQKRLDKFEDYFERKHGRKTIFLTSMITNVRPFMALMAGSSGMSPIKFFPFNILGIVCWAGSVISIGYFLGEEIWRTIEPYWEVTLIAIVLVVLLKLFGKQIFVGKK